MGFHVKDNVFFERSEDGAVRVFKQLPNEDAPTFEIQIEDGSWGSVISSMSEGGEGDLRWYSAMYFHKSTGPVRVIPCAYEDCNKSIAFCSLTDDEFAAFEAMRVRKDMNASSVVRLALRMLSAMDERLSRGERIAWTDENGTLIEEPIAGCPALD